MTTILAVNQFLPLFPFFIFYFFKKNILHLNLSLTQESHCQDTISKVRCLNVAELLAAKTYGTQLVFSCQREAGFQKWRFITCVENVLCVNTGTCPVRPSSLAGLQIHRQPQRCRAPPSPQITAHTFTKRTFGCIWVTNRLQKITSKCYRNNKSTYFIPCLDNLSRSNAGVVNTHGLLPPSVTF